MPFIESNLDKIAQEAHAAGLSIIGPGRNSSYRVYRFLSCGHKQDIAVNMVRRNNFKCQQCFLTRISSEALRSGLQLISKKPRKNRYLYKFKLCEHYQAISLKNVREGAFHCRKCFNKRIETEAAVIGLEVIGSSKKNGYRKYRFTACNHQAEISMGQVRKKHARCRICFEANLHSEAAIANLKYVGPALKNAAKRKYRHVDCGHTAEYQTAKVRIGAISCKTCYENEVEALEGHLGLKCLKRLKRGYRLYSFEGCQHQHEIRLDSVRNGTARCWSCVPTPGKTLGAVPIDRMIAAKECGLKFLTSDDDRAYGIFEFAKCGHTQRIPWQSVRSAQVKCISCQEARFHKEASEVGLTLIGDAERAGYRTYRFQGCSHVQEVQIRNVRLGNFACRFCSDQRRIRAAKSAGLKIIGNGKNSSYLLYEFLKCGHQQEMQTTNVLNSKVRCSECRSNKLLKEASDVGLELLGSVKNNAYRLYRFLACGHEQEIQCSDVRSNSFQCFDCGTTSWNQESDVYLYKIQYGEAQWLKLGYAKNHEARVRRYGLPSEAEPTLEKLVSFSTAKEANMVERLVHEKFSTERIKPELMAKYHSKSGQTECYPITLLDEIKDALDAYA